MANSKRACRVLVVDDEDRIRQFVDRALRKAGYETTLAPNAAIALSVAADQEPFDLLLTDLAMPSIDGQELVRRLRLRDPDLKVLYLTGFSDRLFEEKPLLWANEAFLEKPVSPAGLLEAVSLALFGHTRGPE